METIPYEYETKRLDHLGIVAGICKQINLVNIIDESLPTPSDRKVSCGQATLAMVLNALGLTGRALYLMPEYMRNKPVDLLFGEGFVATDFNDDTLGRALDELFQAGVTGLFADVAAEAVDVFKIEHKYVHLDTSSLSLQGQYESEVAKEAVEKREAVQITYGYSKDKRPDLKQVVVTLITSQASALPLWLEVLDGNSHDTNSFVSTVENYCQQLTGAKEPWFIMDSTWRIPTTQPDGTFKPAGELRALCDTLGIAADKMIITYCVGGGLSTHAWFVLTQLLGFPEVREYDRSWAEWGNLEDVPIEQSSSSFTPN